MKGVNNRGSTSEPGTESGLPSIVSKQSSIQDGKTSLLISPANASKQQKAMQARDKLMSSDSPQEDGMQRTFDTRTQRPSYRRDLQRIGSSSIQDKPKLCLDHVKQNAIKFVSSESDYRSFLSSNGLSTGAIAGGTFLDHYKKQ